MALVALTLSPHCSCSYKHLHNALTTSVLKNATPHFLSFLSAESSPTTASLAHTTKTITHVKNLTVFDNCVSIEGGRFTIGGPARLPHMRCHIPLWIWSTSWIGGSDGFTCLRLCPCWFENAAVYDVTTCRYASEWCSDYVSGTACAGNCHQSVSPYCYTHHALISLT